MMNSKTKQIIWPPVLLDWRNFPFSVMIDLVTKPNFPVVTSEERGSGINWEIGIDIYTLLYIK